jgi:outer membrane protein TolC
MRRLTIWLIIRIISGTVLILCLPGQTLRAQLTLDSVQSMAAKNYPLSRQQELLAQTKNISIENLNKGYLPQFSINGQASYQSDVTEIRIPVPNFKMDPLSKDQYRLTADINQLIYDGGAIKHQVGIQSISSKVDQQKLEVELYALKQRINDIFLGILLLDQQILQLDLLKDLRCIFFIINLLCLKNKKT